MSGDNNSFICGNCLFMCPKDELIMRQKNGLIHILETDKSSSKKTSVKVSRDVADPKLVVKSFQRSAAGKELCNPNYLRPPDILLRTVTYLLTTVILDNRLPWYDVYNFICDRLRAVRQDLIIQRIPARESTRILEPMVRFHIYAEYRLCEAPLSQFDPKLNCDQTMDCLKQILSFCDHMNDENSCSRSEMEAIYQIFNLGSTDTLLRGLKLPENIMKGQLKTAMKLSLAWYCRHYVTVLKNFKSLNLLLQMAFTLKLSEIRRYALEAMSVAYSSKNSSYPISRLALLLLYDSNSAVRDDCMYYNISVDSSSVKFTKSSFDSSKQARRRKAEFICDAISLTDLPRMLLSDAGSED